MKKEGEGNGDQGKRRIRGRGIKGVGKRDRVFMVSLWQKRGKKGRI